MPQRPKRPALVTSNRLAKAYPEATCSLPCETNFQLLIAVMLSAQCTDERVMMVTPALFEAGPDPQTMASLGVAKIKKLIASVGLTNMKAKNVQATSQLLIDRHGGEVPKTMEELVALPGVGRKTANVLLGVGFGIPGLVVDTHVTRISNLLGLVNTKDAVKIEKSLQTQLPKSHWTRWAHLLIYHGRAVCVARRPQCDSCVLNDFCPSATTGK